MLWVESLIEFMLYMLWDLWLKVGYVSWMVCDCFKLVCEDYIICILLVELCYFSGDEEFVEMFCEWLWMELFESIVVDFIEVKLSECVECYCK